MNILLKNLTVINVIFLPWALLIAQALPVDSLLVPVQQHRKQYRLLTGDAVTARLPILLIPALALFTLAGVCRAGRPLVIDDATPVEFGKWQIEAGVGYFKDSETHHFDAPLTLAYGLTPSLEVGAGWGAHGEHREATDGDEWIGSAADVLLTAKWRLFDDKQRAFSLALAPLVTLPVADDERGLGTEGTDYDLALLVTQGFGQTFADVNIGYTLAEDRTEDDRDGIWHYGLAVRRQFTEPLWIVGDVFAVTPAEDGSSSVRTNLGLQYEVATGLILDAAIGTGLHDGPDVTGTVGLTWVF